MTHLNRMILIAMLVLGSSVNALAQEAATAPAEPGVTATTTAAAETATGTDSAASDGTGEGAGDPAPTRKSSYEIRNEFSSILRQTPSEVASILVLDPTLLSNEAFISAYPAIAEYVERHPEVRRNPRFYLAAFATPQRDSSFEEVFEVFTIMLTLAGISLVLIWLVRTTIEQKRWNRLSRQQSEVHNKILDRFGTSSELLDYVKSPAGSKFLESAPIPLHAERPVQNRPMTRVIWSIQIGVVIGAAALGMLLVSLRLDKGAAEGMFAMGAILMSVGVGFIGSAAVSLFISRRLGLWEGQRSQNEPQSLAEHGHVR